MLYIGSFNGELPGIIKNYECGKITEIPDTLLSLSYIDCLESNDVLANKEVSVVESYMMKCII